MAFEGRSKCAVHECNGPCSDGSNLCQDHFVPGMIVEHGNGTCVVTAWYAEHANEAGVILLNDYALGDLFGGTAAFKAKLREQGFVKVRNLRTLEEIEAAKACVATVPGKWSGPSGPWLTEYPWESSPK